MAQKNSYKEFDNKKKFLRLENSPPPHNFSNGPSLNRVISLWEINTCLCNYSIWTRVDEKRGYHFENDGNWRDAHKRNKTCW